MTGKDLRTTLETILPEQALQAAIREAGFQERERKRDAVRFVRAMILSASGPYGGRQADVARMYFESGGRPVVRASFYDWFGMELEGTLKRLADNAMGQAAALPRDLPGILGTVKDWRIVDSTTIKLNNALLEEYPGAGAYAAVKVHKTVSVGCGTTIAYHLSAAREHDSKHLEIDESWRGMGLLVDLGYASIQRLMDCNINGVSVVIRLKENWKPKVNRITRGDIRKTFLAGTDLDGLLKSKVLVLSGKAIDAEVTLGSGEKTISLRLVGVQTPTGAYNFYLTNLPARTGPRQVADLYRVRWEIESDNKLDKSCHRLAEIDARRPEAVRALIHASIIASVIVCTLAHKHQLEEIKKTRRVERITAPLHPQMMARMIGHAALSIAAAMELEGPQATTEWDRLASLFTHMGRDPNWRSRPSILDQLRGWKINPGRPKKAKLASG